MINSPKMAQEQQKEFLKSPQPSTVPFGVRMKMLKYTPAALKRDVAPHSAHSP